MTFYVRLFDLCAPPVSVPLRFALLAQPVKSVLPPLSSVLIQRTLCEVLFVCPYESIASFFIKEYAKYTTEKLWALIAQIQCKYN